MHSGIGGLNNDSYSFWGGIFKIKSSDFINLQKDFINKINKNDTFDYFEEKLFYKKFKDDYKDFNDFFKARILKSTDFKTTKFLRNYVSNKNIRFYKISEYIISLKEKDEKAKKE